MLGVLGRAKAPTYQSLVIAEATGPVRTMSGLEIVATQSYGETIGCIDSLILLGGPAVRTRAKTIHLSTGFARLRQIVAASFRFARARLFWPLQACCIEDARQPTGYMPNVGESLRE